MSQIIHFLCIISNTGLGAAPVLSLPIAKYQTTRRNYFLTRRSLWHHLPPLRPPKSYGIGSIFHSLMR